MAVNELMNYLDSNQIKYVTVNHSQAYTAQEIAAVAHISGKEMAKSVIFRIDDSYCMVVVPANYWVDCENLKEITGAGFVELAREEDFSGFFPNCEVGAMPPFGHLYKMEVFMDERLLTDTEISFNAGSYSLLIRMALQDYVELANPVIVSLSTKMKVNAA